MKKILLLLTAFVLAACSSSGNGSGGGGGTTSAQVTPPHIVASSPISPSKSPSSAQPSGTASTSAPALHDFRVADLTWVGSHGWALGEADCLSGSGQCDAIEQTTDGRTWTSLPAPKAQTFLGTNGCDGDCVTGLRFATDRIGYAYGPQAFFTTADGGRTWVKQSGGGAYALETLNGTVIRVQYPQGLPGSFRVQVASVGSSTWRTVSLPGAPDVGFGTVLGRAAGKSYLLVEGHPAGGGDDARSKLFTSTDGGHTWIGGGEPCPQDGGSTGEVDSSRMTVAPDGSATLLCQRRITATRPFTVTASRNGSFHAGSRTALGSAEITGFGAASDKVILIVLADTFRSTDGGQSFARLAADAGSSPGVPVAIAFSSTTVGHAVSEDRRTIWTTSDAGLRWSAHRFA